MIIFNDAQTGGWGFLENHKDEQELAIQMPTGSGKTYIIKYLSLKGDFENITIIVMSRLVVVRQTYCQYYKKNGSLQIEFFCSEDDRDDDSNGDDDDDFEMPKLDSTTSTNKRKIILTTYVSFPRLIDYLKQTKQVVDMTIFDEAHNCNGEKVYRMLNDETDKNFLGKIRYFSATLNRYINRGILFDYSFSKAVQNRIIRDFDIQCVIAPKGSEHNEHHYLLGEITKIARSTKTCRYLGFCQWSEAERDTGSNVLAMVNEFQKCSNGNWIEGVTGKDPRKKRDCKLNEFQEEHTDSRLLKLLISCRSLAEGVDLKNVHGCIFFDPRQSEIEIKQIIGRSVRPLRDEDNNALPWDEQTPSNIILPLYFDPEKVQEFEDNVEDESNYLKDELLNQEDGMFATVINVIAVLKEYEPLFQFKFYLKRQKSKDDDHEELIPVIPEDNDVDDDLTTTTNKIVKKVVLSCSDEMFTLLRMNPNKLKNGLMQLELGLRDGSVNGFFRKEDFFKKIQGCKDKMNEYIHDINNSYKKWGRKAIIGKYLGSWMGHQIFFVNNPDKYGDKIVNKHPELIKAVKHLESYELECQKQHVLIRIDHIKKLMNEYIHDINNLNKEWGRKAIMGNDLKNWMDQQIFFVNKLDKYSTVFANKFPELIVAVKDLQAYELECQKQQYYIGIDHIKKLVNEYIHDVNHLNKRWDRKAIIGKDLSKWMTLQIKYVNNPDKYGNMFVNKYPELIVAVKDLQAYELECQKQQYYIGIDHIKKLVNEYIHDVNHLTEKWSRQDIMGNDLAKWMNKQITYLNKLDKYGDMFVNQHPRLIEAVKYLQEYELESKKKFQELKKEHKKQTSHQLNNVDLDDNLDADDIEQESLITMTSNVDDDQESVQSSRKRKRGVLEDLTTTRRGPKPRRNGYSVNDLLSDKETYFYILRYGLTDVYKGGWSSCVKRRIAEINDTARRSLAIKFPDSHCIFDVIYTKKFESQQDAHDYEQRFFGEIEVEEFVRRLDGEFYDIPSQTIYKILGDEDVL